MESTNGINPEGTSPEESDHPAIDRLRAWFAANREMLAQAGVAQIEGDYSGSGGLCQYDGARVTMARAGEYKLTRTAEKLIFGAVEDIIDRSGYRFLRGACGRLLLDVPTGRIIHHHQAPIITHKDGIL